MACKGVIDLSNLNGEKGWPENVRWNQAYVNSKLQLVYFTKELAKRVENQGVDVFAVCPGFCKTALLRRLDLDWCQLILFSIVAFWYLRSAYHGAQAVLHCTLEDDIKDKSGKIFRDFEEYQLLDDVKVDVETSRHLWDATEKLIEKTGVL